MQYEGATVWGGIWRISDSHLATLDRYEGVAENCYYRKSIDIFLADQNGSEDVLECEIYFGSDSQDGTVEARDGYLDDILEEHEIPTYLMNTLVEYFIPGNLRLTFLQRHR